jgi:molecular chaperone DnaK
MAATIGIDLGTTFSAVAEIDRTGQPVIVRNKEGANITPSCVAETSEMVMEVGEFARRQWGGAPETAAARFKRDMGTSKTFRINGKQFTPTDLSAFVLKKLLIDTESAVGPVGDAVVTIPANFAHEAREATMAAAKAAGLNIKYIINEPTAAALYYAFKSGETLGGIYAVYDLGGGTFDISIIRVDGQDVEVLATNGIARLGGDDFDAVLQRLVQSKFQALTGAQLQADDFTLNDAEEEKKALSNRKRVTIRVARQLIDIKREEFEEAISSLIVQAEMLCEATLEEAKLQPADVRAVFLSGGSTRMPIVDESIQRVFKKPPVSTINVDEVVALGAALYAAYKGDRSNLSSLQKKSLEKIKVSESTSKCFGTISVSYDDARKQNRIRNSILIRKGEKIPCLVSRLFYTIHDGQDSVNCTVTESTAPETDPRFVKVIWEGLLQLPAGRPKEQEVKVTFAYDDNQIMRCSFVDVATGREQTVNLSLTDSSAAAAIDKFLVE